MAPRTGATSAKGGASSGKAWTNDEKLVYLFLLLEHSGQKINWAEAPIPAGRTRIACERMYGGLRTKLKPDIESMLGRSTTKSGKESSSEPSKQKSVSRGKKRNAPAETEEEHEDEDEETAPPPNKTKRSMKAPVVKHEASEDEGDESTVY